MEWLPVWPSEQGFLKSLMDGVAKRHRGVLDLSGRDDGHAEAEQSEKKIAGMHARMVIDGECLLMCPFLMPVEKRQFHTRLELDGEAGL